MHCSTQAPPLAAPTRDRLAPRFVTQYALKARGDDVLKFYTRPEDCLRDAGAGSAADSDSEELWQASVFALTVSWAIAATLVIATICQFVFGALASSKLKFLIESIVGAENPKRWSDAVLTMAATAATLYVCIVVGLDFVRRAEYVRRRISDGGASGLDDLDADADDLEDAARLLRDALVFGAIGVATTSLRWLYVETTAVGSKARSVAGETFGALQTILACLSNDSLRMTPATVAFVAIRVASIVGLAATAGSVKEAPSDASSEWSETNFAARAAGPWVVGGLAVLSAVAFLIENRRARQGGRKTRGDTEPLKPETSTRTPTRTPSAVKLSESSLKSGSRGNGVLETNSV